MGKTQNTTINPKKIKYRQSFIDNILRVNYPVKLGCSHQYCFDNTLYLYIHD